MHQYSLFKFGKQKMNQGEYRLVLAGSSFSKRTTVPSFNFSSKLEKTFKEFKGFIDRTLDPVLNMAFQDPWFSVHLKKTPKWVES